MLFSRTPFVSLTLGCCLVFGVLSKQAVAQTTVWPAQLRLQGPSESAQILVSVNGADKTREVQLTIAHPEFASIDRSGLLVGVKPGNTEVLVQYRGATHSIPVTVAAADDARSIDFGRQILPTLTKLGCNVGVCHGKASGQKGFRLSLLGYDPVSDFNAITREGRGRRVFPAQPETSLLLRKATAQVAHAGGRKLIPGSPAYQRIVQWIAQGTPPGAIEKAEVAKIEVFPKERVGAPKQGFQQQLAVVATYADGTIRDVTRSAYFRSDLEVVATVDDSGLVSATGEPGETTVMARYMGKVAVFRALTPYAPPAASFAGFSETNVVDRLVAAKWRKLGLQPSPRCDDTVYLRRVMVDLCGRIPTPDEVRAFLADQAPNKRDALVDRLLVSSDHARYFALKWSSILRNSNQAGATQASYAFHNWIRDKVARNRPYDEFVRGIVAASGEWQDAPAINWFWQMRDDQLHQVVADTAQVFLGARIQCARCHHHPYERWSQDDYFGLAGFYMRLGRKSFGEPPPYFSAGQNTMGERHPLTDKQPEPKYIDGPMAKFTPEQDPRLGLVDWMADPNNPFFAKALVNRMWGHFFGVGIVDPIDDIRQTNPPSNPELIDELAKSFIQSKFDVRQLLRLLATSQVYQLESAPTEANQRDQRNFARFYARRLIAEVLLDSVDMACGTQTRFGGIAGTARAIDLPHEGFDSYFLDTFDRPRRVTGCECERSTGANLGQVLLMVNSQDIENKILDGKGILAKLIEAKATPEQYVDELYLRALGRLPRPEEKARGLSHIQSKMDKQKATQDLLWALLNTKEFLFNH